MPKPVTQAENRPFLTSKPPTRRELETLAVNAGLGTRTQVRAMNLDDLRSMLAEATVARPAADVVPAPPHEISNDAAANRRARRNTRGKLTKISTTAAKLANELVRDVEGADAAPVFPEVEPAVVETPAKSTKSKSTKSAKPKTPAAPKSDPIAEHLIEALAGGKSGDFVSISDLAKMITAAYPSDDVRPPVTTISGRVRVGKLPEGWTPARGGERNVRGVVKG